MKKLPSIIRRKAIKVNRKNYHISTYAKFRKINKKLTFKLYEIALHNRKNIGKVFEIDGDKYKLDYTSTYSFYFIKNKETLVRVSDHWTNRGDVVWIRSCFWEINRVDSSYIFGGEIKFSEMQSTFGYLIKKSKIINFIIDYKLYESYSIYQLKDDDLGIKVSIRTEDVKRKLKEIVLKHLRKYYYNKRIKFIDYRPKTQHLRIIFKNNDVVALNHNELKELQAMYKYLPDIMIRK